MQKHCRLGIYTKQCISQDTAPTNAGARHPHYLRHSMYSCSCQ